MNIKILLTVLLVGFTPFAVAQKLPGNGSLLCSLPPKTPFTNWPQPQFDPCHTGYNPYESTLNSSTVGNLVLNWTGPLDQLGGSTPVVADRMLYTGSGIFMSDVGTLFALDVTTGATVWQYSFSNGEISSGPVVGNGMVYVAPTSGGVYAFNAKTGVLVWKYSLPPNTTHLVLVDGVLYVPGTVSVVALNAVTGASIRDYTFTNFTNWVSVANGILYVSTNDGTLHAVNTTTGAELWSDPVGFVDCVPAVASNVVYVAGNLTIFAMNAWTGEILWTYTTTGNPTGLAVARGKVYVEADRDGLVALNASTGTPLWQYGRGLSAHSYPMVANGVAYFSQYNFNDSLLYALNADDGSLLWSYAVPYPGGSTGTVANGEVYFNVGLLYAFHLPGQ